MLSNFEISLENRFIIYKLIRTIASILSLFYFLKSEKLNNNKTYKESLKLFIETTFIAVMGAKFSSILEFFILNNYSMGNFNFNRGFRISGIIFFLTIFFYFKNKVNINTKINLFISGIFGLFVLGKWSCFFLGDTCYGFNTNNIIGFKINGLEPSFGLVHAVTIYDSFFYLVLLLLFIYIKSKTHKKQKLLFNILSIGLIYSFSMEFVRINPRLIFGLTVNQFFYGLTLVILNVHQHILKK